MHGITPVFTKLFKSMFMFANVSGPKGRVKMLQEHLHIITIIYISGLSTEPKCDTPSL
jgi:polyferredoxin